MAEPRGNQMKTNTIVLLMLGAAACARSGEPIFIPVKIDGPVHDPPNHTYWYGPFSECCSVADLDGDGDLDIAAGRNWYEAPEWKKHADFRDGARVNGPETENNSEFIMDVNFDGRPDVVGSGWMRDKGAFWYENPGPEEVKSVARWKAFRIHTANSMEGVIHGDIDGDGDEDILCNHWALEPGQGMTWIEHTREAPWFIEHIIGTQGEGHGNGLGDINMDGRTDIITPNGWWECPPKPADEGWIFHDDYRFEKVCADGPGSGAASHPMLVHDINGDGLNDIMVGSSHNYGLAWLEQKKSPGDRRVFEQRWIETEYGQFHTMALGDLDGDGKPDLLTGKRLFAHHGRDVSCHEPLFVFWYDFKAGKPNRHIMAFNNLQDFSDDLTRRNPAPNFVPAVGMKVHIADMDADGKNDAVIAGKGGLYVFYRRGTTPGGQPRHRLPVEETYPTWEAWRSMPLPEPSPIPRKIHGEGPAHLKGADGPGGGQGAGGNAKAAEGDAGAAGWHALFDGKNLDAFRMGPEKSWVVEDGAIALKRADYDGKEHNADYLWAKEPCGDFVLELEFKVPEKANSGIFLRASDLGDPVYTGIEVQVNNSHGKPQLTRGGTVGAIYDCQAPSMNAAKPPGDWQQMRITCRGPRIIVELNGEEVNEVDLDRWAEPKKNPDGSDNKFPRALKDFARKGHIGFQDHGRPVWYRNIRVRGL